MKKWNDITIDTSDLDDLLTTIKSKENYNPACKLIHYWKDRWGKKILDEVRETKKLPYGFVGDGWPKVSDQSLAIKLDILKFAGAFLEHNHRDVGDAIYQANVISEYFKKYKEHWYIVDFGSGYGRLAIPFIFKYRGQITYIGVDYSPSGLLIAPQFVNQAIDAKVRKWNEDGDIKDYDFVSLPAWRLDELSKIGVDAFISVHSMQEMDRETVDYYVNTMVNISNGDAIFYSINISPKDRYVPKSWELVFDRGFPVNRDGNYNERLFEIL